MVMGLPATLQRQKKSPKLSPEEESNMSSKVLVRHWNGKIWGDL